GDGLLGRSGVGRGRPGHRHAVAQLAAAEQGRRAQDGSARERRGLVVVTRRGGGLRGGALVPGGVHGTDHDVVTDVGGEAGQLRRGDAGRGGGALLVGAAALLGVVDRVDELLGGVAVVHGVDPADLERGLRGGGGGRRRRHDGAGRIRERGALDLVLVLLPVPLGIAGAHDDVVGRLSLEP